MRIVNSSFKLITPISEGAIEELQRIETIARNCYKSEQNITSDGNSAKDMVRKLIKRNHLAMIEHSQISVGFVTNRGVSHELVRHRIASYAQESTRYCNYSHDKFGNQITFIDPMEAINLDPKLSTKTREEKGDIAGKILNFYAQSEKLYLALLENGVSPQIAREILPNGVKTEIVLTCNYRELLTIFGLRCAKDAHPAMRALMLPFAKYMKEKIPEVFESINIDI